MLENINGLEDRYWNSKQHGGSGVMADTENSTLLIEHGELEPIVEKYRAYRKANEQLKEDQEMLEEAEDEEMINL